jgi:hypothetical protein
MTETIREGAIALPLKGNNGENIDAARDAAIDALVREFGGATVLNGCGYWRDGHGKLMPEPVSFVPVAYVNVPEGDAALRKIARHFARDAGQALVYVRFASGVVELVGAARDRTGWRIAQNLHANPGYYVRPDDALNFSPASVFATEAEAWHAFNLED